MNRREFLRLAGLLPLAPLTAKLAASSPTVALGDTYRTVGALTPDLMRVLAVSARNPSYRHTLVQWLPQPALRFLNGSRLYLYDSARKHGFANGEYGAWVGWFEARRDGAVRVLGYLARSGEVAVRVR